MITIGRLLKFVSCRSGPPAVGRIHRLLVSASVSGMGSHSPSSDGIARKFSTDTGMRVTRPQPRKQLRPSPSCLATASCRYSGPSTRSHVRGYAAVITVTDARGNRASMNQSDRIVL